MSPDHGLSTIADRHRYSAIICSRPLDGRTLGRCPVLHSGRIWNLGTILGGRGRSDRTYRRTYRRTHRWSPRGHAAGHATDTSPDASIDTVRPHPPITLKYLLSVRTRPVVSGIEQDLVSSVMLSTKRCSCHYGQLFQIRRRETLPKPSSWLR